MLNKYFICFILIVFCGCKKTDTTFGVPPSEKDYLCEGNSTDSYYPMAVNNFWYYPYWQSIELKVSIKGMATINGNHYFEFGNDQSITSYYRQLSNGDIVIYNAATNADELIAPGSPVYLQTWQTGGVTRKVASVNAEFETDYCKYKNCLKVYDVNSNGEKIREVFFKKGIGIVAIIQYTSNIQTVSYELSDMKLN
jgi:hypothetical protein